jgi:hypothetical protein
MNLPACYTWLALLSFDISYNARRILVVALSASSSSLARINPQSILFETYDYYCTLLRTVLFICSSDE